MAAQNLNVYTNVLFRTATHLGPPVGFFVSGAVPASAPTAPAIVSPSYQYFSEIAGVDVDYGSDILVFPDLDETMTPVEMDSRVLAEAIARRFLTQRGSMPFHPDYGTDVRDYINETMTPAVLQRIKVGCEAEAEKDERVDGANVTASFDFSSNTLTLLVALVTAQGPFSFTLAVTSLTATLLETE